MAAQPTPGLAARLLALRLIERIDEEGTWLSRVFGLEVTRTLEARQSLGDEPVSDRLEAPPRAPVCRGALHAYRRRQGWA